MYPRHPFHPLSFRRQPDFYADEYADGDVIYVTNPTTGRVEPRRTVDRRWYPTAPARDPGQENG